MKFVHAVCKFRHLPTIRCCMYVKLVSDNHIDIISLFFYVLNIKILKLDFVRPLVLTRQMKNPSETLASIVWKSSITQCSVRDRGELLKLIESTRYAMKKNWVSDKIHIFKHSSNEWRWIMSQSTITAVKIWPNIDGYYLISNKRIKNSIVFFECIPQSVQLAKKYTFLALLRLGSNETNKKFKYLLSRPNETLIDFN